MDIFARLRVALWALVLSLWATMLYQFWREEEALAPPRMQWVSNPFPRPESPKPAAVPGTPPTLEGPWEQTERVLATAPPPGNFIKPVIPKEIAPLRRQRPIPKSLRRHEQLPVDEAAAPQGFRHQRLAHFNVYSEGSPASEEFLAALENLYSNLMIDLAAFSPWAQEERVSIFLFRNQNSYRRVTGRPAWSGGASSVSKRKIYLYESDELLGILAHELCHIYFDGFFNSGKTNPLWLSEGLATLVQVERGLAKPNWLPENLEVLAHGGGYNFEDLMKVEDTSGANDDNVRLWYTQSYSIVRFLVRSQWKSSFYHFCRHLRDGRPIQEALLLAYGMPFNRLKALEYVWRYDIQTRRITDLKTAAQ